MLKTASETKAFASKTMLNILNAGLNNLLNKSHQMQAQNILAQQSQAHVSLKTKRTFIQWVRQNYGTSALLSIGSGVTQFVDSPAGHALLQGSDPFLLFKKWQRLERYIHSQHYVEFECFDNYVKVEHKSNTQEQPTFEEDLVVLGVLCALLYEIAARNIVISHSSLASEGFFSYPSLRCNADELHRNAPWYIHWQVPEQTTNNIGQVSSLVEYGVLNIVNKTKQAIIELGLLEVDLQQVAKFLALSTRSLQRRLSDEGHGFAKLLQDVRVHHASQSLLNESLCIAEIGFASGFADQAHFSRVFKQWTGMSPKQYTQFKEIHTTSQ